MILFARGPFFCAALAAVCSLANPASAAYTIFVEQSGLNVVATGGGSINTTGLTSTTSGTPARVNSGGAMILIGSGSLEGLQTVSGPTNFGDTVTGSAINANSATGSYVGVVGSTRKLLLPSGYVSGTNLSTSTAQWNNTTLSGLNLMPGLYAFTWGSGANADSLTVRIGPASLSISATHSNPIFQAGPGTITLTVNNTGGATAGIATASDTIDSAFTINGVSPGCSVSGQIVTCTIAAGSLAASAAFNVYVTASSTASSSISNVATLSDNTDTVATGTSNDTIAVNTEAPIEDPEMSQLSVSGSTNGGACASGNHTLTATVQLENTSVSTMANPYAVNVSLSGENTLISNTSNATTVPPNGTITFTFDIQLATCNTFHLGFDVRSD